jgi:hypothetical protein
MIEIKHSLVVQNLYILKSIIGTDFILLKLMQGCLLLILLMKLVDGKSPL